LRLSSGNTFLTRPQPPGPVLGGALADDALKNPVEMGDGLEAHLDGHLRDPALRIEQKPLRGLHAASADVLGEVQACVFLELFTEIKGAHVDGLRHPPEREGLRLMGLDKLAGLRNCGWIPPGTLKDQAVCEQTQVP
jgi:hypothetical protein